MILQLLNEIPGQLLTNSQTVDDSVAAKGPETQQRSMSRNAVAASPSMPINYDLPNSSDFEPTIPRIGSMRLWATQQGHWR